MITAKSKNILLKSVKPYIDIRAMHLDLKGLPPAHGRLLKLLEIFQTAGYNALLVEWEDMFPWTVNKKFCCETAYTEQEVKTFYAKAKELGFEVIPLVQCLGHMETPLRLPEYRHLREVSDSSSNLNAAAPGASDLVLSMVKDVLAFAPGCAYFHLGGDESWSFGTHPDARAFIEKYGKGALYLKHIGPILDFLNEKNIRPILWHDMMIEWDDKALKELGERADVCVWGYAGHPDETPQHWNTKYIKRFRENKIPLWCATAYKCGTTNPPNSDLMPFKEREENALAWMDVSRRFGMKGIIATAWSRGSTDGPQYCPIDAHLDVIFALGSIVHEGKTTYTEETLLKAIEDTGERARFEHCRDVLMKLTNVRNQYWTLVRGLHESITTATDDPRRRGSSLLRHYLRWLHDALINTESVRREVLDAFRGLVPDVWMERYLNERLCPLREQILHLEPRVLSMNEPLEIV